MFFFWHIILGLLFGLIVDKKHKKHSLIEPKRLKTYNLCQNRGLFICSPGGDSLKALIGDKNLTPQREEKQVQCWEGSSRKSSDRALENDLEKNCARIPERSSIWKGGGNYRKINCLMRNLIRKTDFYSLDKN